MTDDRLRGTDYGSCRAVGLGWRIQNPKSGTRRVIQNRMVERTLSGEHKGHYVAAMFDRIAPRYDLMNRMMSLGQDQAWRRRMAALAEVPVEGLVLDLASGTGDVGLAVLERYPSATVVGADFSVEMMRVGRQKLAGAGRFAFVSADALNLPFPDTTFDTVLHAFLMRNIADILAGWLEQWRVLKPGGRVVSLDIVGPQATWARAAYHLFFETLVPQVGKFISGDATAYNYLPRSVLDFPSPPVLSRLMREAGFENIRYEHTMLGSIVIHVGEKPAG